MNIFIVIMLIFALIGFIDKTFHLRWGLELTFDRGLSTMGSLAVSVIGIYCVGMTFVQRNIDVLTKLNHYLFFDSSILVGSLLAPDMGGYPIVSQMTTDQGLIVFSGILLSATLGQTICFQLPVFLAFLEEKEINDLMRGFIIGIVTIPIGLLISYFFIDISLKTLFINLLPILIICLFIAFSIIKIPRLTIKIFSIFANFIKAISYIFFFIVILGLYIPELSYVDLSMVEESVVMVMKMVIIVSGSMVLSEVIFKFGAKYIDLISEKLNVNKESVIGFVLNCASSLAMLPLYSKMNKKGKLINAAFSVSGAYVFGGQLGFISTVANENVTVYVLVKLICGLLSVLCISIMYRKVGEESD